MYKCLLCFILDNWKLNIIYPSERVENTKKCSYDSLKVFVCDVCNKTFGHRGNFKKHYRTHTGEKPFVCQVCFKRFAQKVQCQRHIFFHHQTLEKDN